jgi:hypothetical protein
MSVKSLLTVRMIRYCYMFSCHYDCDWWSGQFQKWSYRILQFVQLSIHCNLHRYVSVTDIFLLSYTDFLPPFLQPLKQLTNLCLFNKCISATQTACHRMRWKRSCSITGVCNARLGQTPINDRTSKISSPSANHFEATSWEMG